MYRITKSHLSNILLFLMAFIAGYFLGRESIPPTSMHCKLMVQNEREKVTTNELMVQNEREKVTTSDCSHAQQNTFDNSSFNREENIIIATDPVSFESKVTIILYSESKIGTKLHLDNIKNTYPKIKTMLSTNHDAEYSSSASTSINYVGKFSNKGEALTRMLQLVNTPYFLHIDSNHLLGSASSDQSAGWLLHALEQVAEIDVIGGSVFIPNAYQGKFNKLEIPCYRLRHHNWTYSEMYEYQQSIGDVMICDRTSSSFLARTAKIKHVKFEGTFDDMMFADFFLEAKHNGINVATKPEVMFSIPESEKSSSSVLQHVTDSLTPSKFLFGLKHGVLRIKTMNGTLLDFCARHRNGGVASGSTEDILCDYDKAIKHWGIKHWAYSGTFAPPSIVNGLQLGLIRVGKFFDERNILFWIDAGISLGAVKMRGILPWDSGDVDTGVYMDKSKLIDLLNKEFVPKYNYVIQNLAGNQVNIYPRNGFGGLVCLFTHKMPSKVDLMRIDVNGYATPFQQELFKSLRTYYGITYLQHKMYGYYGKAESTHCNVKINACLPDFRNIFHGRGGTFREYFEET